MDEKINQEESLEIAEASAEIEAGKGIFYPKH